MPEISTPSISTGNFPPITFGYLPEKSNISWFCHKQSAKAAVVLRWSNKLTFAISWVFEGIAQVYFLSKYIKLSSNPEKLSIGNLTNSFSNCSQSFAYCSCENSVFSDTGKIQSRSNDKALSF